MTLLELQAEVGPRRAVRPRGRPPRGGRRDEGADRRPDHREGLLLRPRPQLREGLHLHLQGRHHAPVDVPRLHGQQGVGE